MKAIETTPRRKFTLKDYEYVLKYVNQKKSIREVACVLNSSTQNIHAMIVCLRKNGFHIPEGKNYSMRGNVMAMLKEKYPDRFKINELNICEKSSTN
jgi:biotin operon repressor